MSDNTGTAKAETEVARCTRRVQGYLVSVPTHELDASIPYSFAYRFMGELPRERVNDKGQILVAEDTGRCGPGTVVKVWRSFEGEIRRLYHVKVLLPADRGHDRSRVLDAFKRVWLEHNTITEAEITAICRYANVSVDDPESPLSVCLRVLGGLRFKPTDADLRALIAAVSEPPPFTTADVRLAWERRGKEAHPKILAAWNVARALAEGPREDRYKVQRSMEGKL